MLGHHRDCTCGWCADDRAIAAVNNAARARIEADRVSVQQCFPGATVTSEIVENGWGVKGTIKVTEASGERGRVSILPGGRLVEINGGFGEWC